MCQWCWCSPTQHTTSTRIGATYREGAWNLVGRVLCFQDKEISGEGTELLLASWQQKSSKSYDLLFRKWVDWCNKRHSDPVSGPISEVVNLLAHMFEEGYQYHSLNAYRSAISSVHEKADGYEVGQHPLVSRLLKGVFNQ